MEFEEEILLEDDQDVLDVIDIGFPRQIYQRPNFFVDMDEFRFFQRFRLTKPTVLNILESIEEQIEFNNDLNNSVSPINQVLTTLLFYGCNGHQQNIADFIGMHQTTASRIIQRVSRALASLRPNYIRMPSENEIVRVQNNFFNIARFPRVIGAIDCTHIKIRSPGGEDAEIYRNRKSYFSINTQLTCDSHLRIRDIVARWPGSSHDSTIFSNSRLKARFENGEFQNCVLLGDSGYPLKEYLLTPLANPNIRAEQLYNESQFRTNTVERNIGVWKRRFPVLAYGLRCRVETSQDIIVATAVLNNIALNMNEGVPPHPENINVAELEYLIEQGDIPPVRNVQALVDGRVRVRTYRQTLIDNYFSNLHN